MTIRSSKTFALMPVMSAKRPSASLKKKTKTLILRPEIVNIVVASTVKAYSTFLVWISTSLVSPFFALTLSGLR